MKHLFIINPASGKGKALKLVPEIKRVFAEKNEEYVIEYTQRPGHTKEIAARYAKEGADRVYAVGGDGTLNEILNGMMGCKASLGVIPGGSGNDFFRSIAGNNTVDIIQRTVNGTERPVDVGRVNGRYFINIASVGFDASVVLNTDLIKKKTPLAGSAAYVASIIATIFKNRGYPIHLSIDGKSFSEKILLSAIANGKFYGGGMLPAPDAVIDDGLFDVCTVRSASSLKILFLFPRYMKGLHGKLKEVSFYRGKTVKIQCEESIPVNIDGEVERATSLEFEILPKAVNMIIPAASV